jgi:hypothetical protein
MYTIDNKVVQKSFSEISGFNSPDNLTIPEKGITYTKETGVLDTIILSFINHVEVSVKLFQEINGKVVKTIQIKPNKTEKEIITNSTATLNKVNSFIYKYTDPVTGKTEEVVLK